jgi:hypothetical protein
MRMLIAAVFLVLFSTPARSTTASSLREDCKAYFDFCAGYVSAIIDTAYDDQTGKKLICTNMAKYDDLVATVISFLERHRDRGVEPARSQVAAALLEQYPCRR